MNLAGLIVLLIFLTFGHSTIIINSPLVTPFPDNVIPYLYSNFGQINYDKSQTFDLLILNTSLCANHTLQLNTLSFVVVKSNLSENCSFTKQAMLAEWLGAKGIIISSELVGREEKQIVLADDGNGKRVHIASLFITGETYNQLSKLQDTSIQITANFPIPKAKKTKLTFFLSSSQRASYVFLKQLGDDFKEFDGKIDLDVIYFTYFGSVPRQNCYLNEYCSFDYDKFQPVSGQAIIRQQLHQYNILKTLGASSWLTYMATFDEVCNYNWLQIEQCTSAVHQKTGLKDVGMAEAHSTLALWRQKQKQYSFETFPQVAINGMIFRGSLEYDTFIVAVCQSLTSPPSYCTQPNQTKPKSKSKHYSEARIIASFLLTILTVSFISFYIYRKCVKQESTVEMTARVNELVANYASQVSSRQGQRRARQHEELHEEL